MEDGQLMKRFVPACVGLLLLIGALRGADPHFLKPAELNVESLLPPPPLAGSPESNTEVETVLRLQASRTQAEVDRANAEAKLTPAAFASVMGEKFTADNFPAVFALLTDAAADSKLISDAVKTRYSRKRPQYIDSRIKPSIEGETDASYPSGHATRGMLWAIILGEIAPDKKQLLVQRGLEIGWDRVVAGVHFPSDISAGRALGQMTANAMAKDANYQTRLAKAKTEFETFMASHPVGAAAPVTPH
jgi:acid phosphatase (class A)